VSGGPTIAYEAGATRGRWSVIWAGETPTERVRRRQHEAEEDTG
jgi:hypothetical protein